MTKRRRSSAVMAATIAHSKKTDKDKDKPVRANKAIATGQSQRGDRPRSVTRDDRKRRRRAAKIEDEVSLLTDLSDREPAHAPTRMPDTSIKGDTDASEPPQKRKRRNKYDFSDVDFPPRFHHSKKLVGAHTSASGGAQYAVINALKIGARSFGLFTKNQLQWKAKALDDEALRLFPLYSKGQDHEGNQLADGRGIDSLKATVCHACYLINLASPIEEAWKMSCDAFVDEARRCDKLGIGFLVFHPGSTKGKCTRNEGVANIARGINQAVEGSEEVVILVENMAHKHTGNVIGGTPEELARILAQINPENRGRVGVLLDTCHAFAAGYDMRTPESYDATMSLWQQTIGLENVRAIHCNDSKGELGSHRDLHENIGMGYLGLRAFALLMSDKRWDDKPIILETPMLDGTLNASGPGGGVWSREIALLHRLEQLGGRSNKFPLEKDAEVRELFDEIKKSVETAREKEKDAKEAKKMKDAAARDFARVEQSSIKGEAIDDNLDLSG